MADSLEWPFERASIPSTSGSYILEFELRSPLELTIGRLGVVTLEPGTLRYYGSAFGPGGLRARVWRHLQPEGRRDRWHVDAVTRRVRPSRVVVAVAAHECDLVDRDLADGAWIIAVPGFGSSDCSRCRGHLLHRQSTNMR